MRLAVASASLLLLSCSPHDCVAGDDSSVAGTWTVQGAAPTAASCADVGIDTVRLAVYCGPDAHYVDRLEGPCAAGALDTRTAVLAAGTYDVAWEGLHAGAVVAHGEHHTLVTTQGGHAVVPVVDFISLYDPAGTDASVSAHWTIHGVTPSSASCDALGVTRVRVAVLHGGRTIELARLSASCTTGVIDTRPNPILAQGEVTLQLQALDAHDTVLFSGAMAMEHVTTGPTHVALYGDVPVDFVSSAFDPHGTDATISLAWTLDRATASIDVCDAVAADSVHLVLYAQDDAARAHGVSIAQAPCYMGGFDSGATALVRAGTYLVSVQARDVTDATLVDVAPSAAPVEVAVGSALSFPNVDLAFPTTLTLTLDWGDPMTGATSTCVGAGVDTMSYTLTERVSGAIVAQASAIACAQRVSFDAAHTTGFGAGTYDLAISGVGATHTWHSRMTECTGIVVAADTIEWQACRIATP